jgi:hypothetical protein
MNSLIEHELRIAIRVVTSEGEEHVDQPLNAFPLQGLPHSLAINVGSDTERQVIAHWHYFDIHIYRKAEADAEAEAAADAK